MLTLLALAAGAGPTEADVVAYGKRLDVHQIDARIDSERYTAWLRKTLGPGAKITWHGDDCAESGSGNDEVPLCFTADAYLRPRGRVSLSVAVGSCRKGPWGKPIASPASLYDKRSGHIHIENVPLDALEAKVRAIAVPPR